MDHLLQHFEAPVHDGSGDAYRVFVYGRRRPDDIWEGWLQFERSRDGERLETPVETTQPSPAAVIHWATGLSGAYFEGALARAARPRHPLVPAAQVVPAIVGSRGDRTTRRERLREVEKQVVSTFRHFHRPRLLTSDLFEALPYANADIVRALEDLEKQGRMLIRKTEEGSDWVFLTEAGLHEVGLTDMPHAHVPEPIAPPKQPKPRK